MTVDKDLLLRVVAANIDETCPERDYWCLNYQPGMVTAWEA